MRFGIHGVGMIKTIKIIHNKIIYFRNYLPVNFRGNHNKKIKLKLHPGKAKFDCNTTHNTYIWDKTLKERPKENRM